MISLVPLRVCQPFLPPETRMVRTFVPSRYTVATPVARLTLVMRERPTVNEVEAERCP